MTFLLTVVWPLLRRYWGVALAVVLAGWLMLACRQRDHALEQRGRAIERTMQLDRQLATLATKHRADSVRADSLDRVVRVDTVRLAKWLTKYDTVLATLDIHDTVSVKQFVATSSGTVTQCRETTSTLVLSCAAKDAIIADDRQIIATLRSAVPVPPKDRRLSLGITAGYGATYSNGSIHTGPSATVGGSLRLF